MSDSRRFAVPRPSSRPNKNMSISRGGSRHSMIPVSRPSIATAAPDCWNNLRSSTSSTSSSAQNQNELWTTCLFCPTSVVYRKGVANESPEVIAERTKLLQNLCFHLKINDIELQNNGTRLQFPFCPTCDKHVKELLEFQETLESIQQQQKIADHVTTIQRFVAERHVVGSTPTLPLERHKFVRLYDRAFDVYRSELSMKHQINNSESFFNTAQPSHNQLNMSQFHENTNSPTTSSGRTDDNGFGRIEMDYEDNMTVSIDPLDIGANTEGADEGDLTSPPSHMQEEEQQSYADYHDEAQDYLMDSDHDDFDPSSDYNENRNTSVISSTYSNVISLTSLSSEGSERDDPHEDNTPTTAGSDGVDSKVLEEVINRVNIKHEMNAGVDDEEESDDNGGGGTAADIYVVTKRKRRILFEGIEIYRCNGTGKRKNDEFLQCSFCIYTLPLRKLRRKEAKQDMSPYMKLKMHMQHEHNIKPGLLEHKKSHSVSGLIPCDICQRPIKGRFNLLQHKFSHKSDEEKKVALANKENGANLAGLSKKLKQVSTLKQKKSAKATNEADESNGDGASSSSNAKSFASKICNKYFLQTSHLKSHMIVHSYKKAERGQSQEEQEGQEKSTSSTSAAAF